MELMECIIGYRIRCWALLIYFIGGYCLHQASAQSDKFEKRYFLLPPELLSAINQLYATALQDAKRDRREMNRGPGRLFLEERGISFPPGASATVSDRQLVAANTPESLKSIEELVESYITHVVEGPSPPETKEERIPRFDPFAMDFEALKHKAEIYRNVTVITNTPVELEIMHQSGGATLPLAEMAPEIQARYGYDQLKAETFLQSPRDGSTPNTIVSISSQPSPDQSVEKTDNAEVPPADFADSSRELFSDRRESVDGRRFYDKILLRDGRLLENVLIAKDNRRLKSWTRENASGQGELLEIHDAPSKLLLDFEEFEELFRRVVVTDGRTQLYELSRDGLEGGQTFQQLAQNPPLGAGFVSVPEGYLLAHMNWMSLPASAIELLMPISKRAFAVANVGSLIGLAPSKWWNEHAGHRKDTFMPGRLVKKEPSKNGVLYSPFNPETPLLGNTVGEMKRLWVEHRAGKNGALSLVETANGLFLGYYHEHSALEASELTWADAIRDKSGRFFLTKVSVEKIKPGDSFLRIFDASARKVLGAEFKEVGQLKLGGQHFQALLQRGLEAAVQDRVLPQGDGVRFPEFGIESVSSPALDRVVITDQVDARLKDMLPHAYIFDVESKQRVIEIRKEKSGGRITLQESKPQRRKQNEVVEVAPDLDGGLRLTDGKRIYELKPALGGVELVVWEAARNNLKRF